MPRAPFGEDVQRNAERQARAKSAADPIEMERTPTGLTGHGMLAMIPP
jgi:hypothetical protein